MSTSLHRLVLPDLGLPDATVVVSGWLVETGSAVVEGDRLLEVLAGSVTVDLPAPASGILSEQLVGEDDELHVGQVLAIVTACAADDESA
ncbi:MAG TPA: lipoyl domain-containing protein [Pirellulales bacterium]|nr:lipoyl domain-containing protein [Pirellulales bacterium]